jgi:hypothetical protein
MTIQELAEKLECEIPALKLYVRKFFPQYSVREAAQNETVCESLVQKRRELVERLRRVLADREYASHEDIAARIGIDGKLLSALIGGRTFAVRTIREDDDTDNAVYWYGLGVSIRKRSKKLEILPFKKTFSEKTLLNYAPGESPLNWGTR